LGVGIMARWLADIGKTAAGMVLAAIIVPVFAVVKLFHWPFAKGRECTPDEVAAYLRGALNGTDNEEIWDDFENIPIRDSSLENIRRQAIAVKWPLDRAGRETFERLLQQLTNRQSEML
jgi:hypothetical protein